MRDLNSLDVPASTPTAAASSLVLTAAREYLQHYFLRMLMFSSWFPSVSIEIAAFFDPKIETAILKFMQRLGPYAMGWMQLMSASSALVFSVAAYSIHRILKNPTADLKYVPSDFLPLLRFISSTMNKQDPTSAMTSFLKNTCVPLPVAVIFTALNFFAFATTSIIQGKQLEGDGKFFLDILRLSLKPATLAVLNMMIAVLASLTIAITVSAAKALYSRCHQSMPSAANNSNALRFESPSLNGERDPLLINSQP